MKILILAILLGALYSGRGMDLYVSTQGSDTWTGRLPAPNFAHTDGPFASLTRARDEIRQLKSRQPEMEDPVKVWVRGGTYYFTNTFQLEPADSGTPAAPIIYLNYNHEHPVLEGGKPIGGFEIYKGSILQAKLKGQGLAGDYFRQLFFDGQRQPLARYPNMDPHDPIGGGWAYVAGKWVPYYKDISGETDANKRVLPLKPADFHHWSNPSEGEVFIFPRYDWWNNIVPISKVDEKQHQLILAANCSSAIRPGDRFFVQNLFEELDAPGEWYLDKHSWTLYFWPPAPLAGKPVLAPVVHTLVKFRHGTHDITVRGFVLQDCDSTAVQLEQTTNCLIAASIIHDVGDYYGHGVSINGGLHNGVEGCDLDHIGCDGIYLAGGNQLTLTPAENYADNNCISHAGVYFAQGVGIELRGVGNRATHNLIYDLPRMGILFNGNLHLMEFNHIHHVNLETQDSGIIYSGGNDWLSSRGCIIRYNFLHDSIGYGQAEDGQWVSPFNTMGIYLDDDTCGVDVIGNVVARCPCRLIYMNYGRDNLIENNIFINAQEQLADCHGWFATDRDWLRAVPRVVKAYDSVAGQPAWQKLRGFNIDPTNAIQADGTIMADNAFLRNIFSSQFSASPALTFSNFSLGQLQRRIFSSQAAQPLWTFENVSFDHFVSDSNLIWHDGAPVTITERTITGDKYGKLHQYDWAAWQQLGFDRHSAVAAPLFVNPAKDDYQLQAKSPAWKMGFQKIPMDQIGPYASPLRATWPVAEN